MQTPASQRGRCIYNADRDDLLAASPSSRRAKQRYPELGEPKDEGATLLPNSTPWRTHRGTGWEPGLQRSS